MPRTLLFVLRDRDDPMIAHERNAFASAAELPIEQVEVHILADGMPDRSVLKGMDAVFFGGSGAYSVFDDVPWIRMGFDMLQEVCERGVPAWASCFGFQGLAHVLGGEVIRDDSRMERGSTLLSLTEAGAKDPLVGALPPVFWVQQGHHDVVTRLPDSVELLITGDRVKAQAFRVKGAPFWASQFHPELTRAQTLERFTFYKDHYFSGPGDFEAVLSDLAQGQDSPEVASLLGRVVRGEY